MKMVLDAGLLGKCFGSSTNAPTNIAGFVLIVVVLSIVLVPFRPSTQLTSEYLTKMVPVVTLGLGFLFGKVSKS